jgi:hypothetical protein
VRLRFGNDEIAFGCAVFRQHSCMDVCRPELGEVMKFAAQAFCFYLFSDSVNVEGSQGR